MRVATTAVSSDPGRKRRHNEDAYVCKPPLFAIADGMGHEVTKQRTTLGRSRECDVQIEDPSASRRHAELRQEGTAYWIVDLDSTNGLEVNGLRVQRAKLDHGDKITIGSTELAFRRDVS